MEEHVRARGVARAKGVLPAVAGYAACAAVHIPRCVRVPRGGGVAGRAQDVGGDGDAPAGVGQGAQGGDQGGVGTEGLSGAEACGEGGEEVRCGDGKGVGIDIISEHAVRYISCIRTLSL